ncbi:hypothetical protein LSUE1_G007778 [Lachnellula suecica]|uniref:Uncharacterized protein n=1 Tax=Lachnellula suecica TaxID=602035 RepID=A0A8T9C1Z5_9HELO|nr:hypothetical protein LSUE1_G007778 [Lachnellula suecica]
MPSGMVSHLMRRGAEASFTYQEQLQLPTWGLVLLGVTAVIYMFVSGMIEYTFGRIVPTLTMIESPADSILFEPLPTDDTDATLNKNAQPELLVATPKLITSSFRSTIRLLSSKGGFRARFRGISVFIVNNIAVSWVAQFMSFLPFFPRGAGAVIAAVLCAQLSMAWTHIVISEPSPKMWFRRLPSVKTWKKVAIPTAILALAEQVAICIPVYIGIMSGAFEQMRNPNDAANMSPREASVMASQGLGLGALALVLSFVLVVPADVALTRVQASLLADSEETIVPFDRSFNGKVIPEIVGGSGVIGMLDAWKTFDMPSRVRLVKTYLKVFAMELAVGLLFFFVALGEVALVLSKSKKVEVPAPSM